MILNCSKCENRLYQIYIGGAKKLYKDHYYCKVCDTISREILQRTTEIIEPLQLHTKNS